MRNEDRVRIGHILEVADELAGFIEGRARADLDQNRMLLFAVVRAIEILGEAASKVSTETRMQIPGIPWSEIVAMRNRLIHGYFDIDTRIVWKTATEEIPPLVPMFRAAFESGR